MRSWSPCSCRVLTFAMLSMAACGDHGRPIVAKDSSVAAAHAVPTILLIGTSLTAGFGLDPVDAWSTRLQQMIDSAGLRFHVSNAGVSGETSADALHRMDWLLSQGTPAIVVVETGANDALRGQSVDAVNSNLEAILDRLDRLVRRPVIVVAGMEALPNMGRAYGQRFRSVFPAAAAAHRAVYLPFFLAGVAGVDSLNQADGLHPNAAGSRRVAVNVWRTIGPILDSLQRR